MQNFVPVSYDPFRIVGELESFAPVNHKCLKIIQKYIDDPYRLSMLVEAYILKFEGRIEKDKLLASCHELSQQLPLLRSIFSGDLRSIMVCKEDRIEVKISDLSQLSSRDQEENCRKYEDDIRTQAFDIYNGPLFRIHILQLSEKHGHLLVAVHGLLTQQIALESLLCQLGQVFQQHQSDQQLTKAASSGHLALSSGDDFTATWPVSIVSMTNLRRATDTDNSTMSNKTSYAEQEERIKEVWKEVLGFESIPLDQSFFDIGGQSIQVATILTKLHKRFDLKLNLREFQDAPTVRSLAALLAKVDQKEARSLQLASSNVSHAAATSITISEFVAEALPYLPDPLELATDYPRPPNWQGKLARTSIELSGKLWEKCQKISQQQKSCSIESFILGQFLILLGRYTRQSEMICMLDLQERALSVPLCFTCNLEQSLELHLQNVFQQLERWPHGLSININSLLTKLDLPIDASRSQLFAVQYSCSTSPGGQKPGLANHTGTPADLQLHVSIAKDQARLTLEFRSDLFEEKSMQSFLAALEQLCSIDESQLSMAIGRLTLLSNQQEARMVTDHNQTQKNFSGPPYLHKLIDLAAKTNPETTAIQFNERQVSYRQLEEQANQAAHMLLSKGVQVGDIVGISLYRSPEMIIAMLAILKAGATYMPMDPDYPIERLDYMLENSKARFVVTENAIVRQWPQRSVQYLLLDKLHEQLSGFPKYCPNLKNLKESSLAYVIYTSGSTGKPKGVAISHRAVVNFLHALEQKVNFTSHDRLLAVTTISFDISVLEIFSTLKAGGTLILMSQESTLDATALQEAMNRHDISIMQATPATWRLLLESGWQGKSNLTVICGGEAFPRDLASQLVPVVKTVWNAYGPTEATVWASLYPIVDAEQAILIGKPMANYKTYVLDEHLQTVPQGMTGNLYLGGESLAEGYLNREDLTKGRFIANPFVQQEKIYDTGDVVRYRSDLNLEYISRRDNQVKIRGFRIELGEIEALVSSLDQVKQGVVIVREDEPGDKRLVCYVLLREGMQLTKSQLDQHLTKSLPDYMIPNHLMILDHIPLTGSGKVDRKSLPQPNSERKVVTGHDDELPSSTLEKQIAEIWSQQLGVDYITVHDNFFDIGGHSLLAIKTVKAMVKLSSMKLGIRDLLTNTLGQLAAQLERN